jgi:hypothetical protein
LVVYAAFLALQTEYAVLPYRYFWGQVKKRWLSYLGRKHSVVEPEMDPDVMGGYGYDSESFLEGQQYGGKKYR